MARAFQIPNSGSFQGNDGPWSTFPIQVGTPPGTVNILPASSLNYIIVISSEFCSGLGLHGSELENCTLMRGGTFDSSASSTFTVVSNKASPEATYGLYFPYEQHLYPLQCTSGCNNSGVGYYASAASQYGSDIVRLASADGVNISLAKPIITPYRGVEPELGQLGLAVPPLNYTKAGIQPHDSPLSILWNEGTTPSRYWAYSAGSYRQQVHGSLTIGGYDKNRGDVANVPYRKISDQQLTVRIDQLDINIDGQSPNNNTAWYSATVDTTVPELWLSNGTCDAIATAFGLTWNEEYYMYLVSGEQRQQLKERNPSITFTLGGLTDDGKNGASQTIRLSYDSFDLEVGWPLGGIGEQGFFDGRTSYYFPLKRTTNPSQYTLGRAFFQES